MPMDGVSNESRASIVFRDDRVRELSPSAILWCLASEASFRVSELVFLHASASQRGSRCLAAAPPRATHAGGMHPEVGPNQNKRETVIWRNEPSQSAPLRS